jgi:serine/threonine protein kinase
MNPGYAEREISVLAKLNHRNIIKLYHCHVPTHPHDTPFLITEYCDKSTLKELVCVNMLNGQMVPKLFACQIFTSLAKAVAHCHNGDPLFSVWDEITHRDLTLSNIFIKTDERKAGHDYEYPLTIKLGDWGCGITQSEWINGDIEVDELPMADPMYDPPEKAYPEESTDVYQIGVVMWCILCFTETPDRDLSNLVGLRVWPGQGVYSKDLRDSITACMKEDPEERPSVGNLLTDLHQKRAALIANGFLGKVPFEWFKRA